MPSSNQIARRSFLVGTAATAAAASMLSATNLQAASTKKGNKICAFIKFVQSLSYDQLAETIAELGFDGIEATIRDRGQILPANVEEELPKLVDALKKHGLEINVMASSVNSIDQPHTEKVLRTAAGLGIKRYRLKGYSYDLNRSIDEQLDQLRPVVKDLIDMGRDLGISAVYQNHSGNKSVGAAIWDLDRLFENYPANEFGVAFDIRHATVEGGLCWPIHFGLMKPHLAAVYVKDFRWNGNKPENVPLGTGRVNKSFFPMIAKAGFTGPISLHVEYLGKSGTQENIAALKNDLKTLRQLLSV